MNRRLLFILFFFLSCTSWASYLLIPMDAKSQSEHLKAYGIAYWVLDNGEEIQWLLNYRGGSFLVSDNNRTQRELTIRGVNFEVISAVQAMQILDEVRSPSKNMDAILLETAPKIAVYSPSG